MSDGVAEFTLDNGMRVLVEPVTGVRSASFSLLIPAGASYDPADGAGMANATLALALRGAGERDNRAFHEFLDDLGVQRSESTEIEDASFSAATIADHVEPALEAFADLVRRPQLCPEEFESCRASLLQELQGIEDNPAQKLFRELKRRVLPHPLGRPTLGDFDTVREMSADAIRTFHETHYRPDDAILSVAGAVRPEEIVRVAERLFGDWPAKSVQPPALEANPQYSSTRIDDEKIQSHLAMAYDAAPYDDPGFFDAHAVAGVLGGGMSSRLWSEIREKRGLCYSVSATYSPLKSVGRIFGYAATTSPERTEETANRMQDAFERLGDGVAEDELRRVRADLKSSLVLRQESTAARAGASARSLRRLGRVRTVDEIADAIDRVTPATAAEYLRSRPLTPVASVTLGPETSQPAEAAS